MPLELLFHPLSSYCHKVLIALYENATPFEPVQIDPGDPDSRARLARHWPFAKFPVLLDGPTVVPESSIIIEYLDTRYPGAVRFIPADIEAARETRLRDRFFDLYIDDQLGRIALERIAGRPDSAVVEKAKATIATALDLAERELAGRSFAAGEVFTMADCAAAPALFYADWIVPFAATHPWLAGYLERLKSRPSYARVLREAAPYFHLVPR